MTIYELEVIHNKHQTKDLSSFLNQAKLTQDKFVKILCQEEIEDIQSKYNQKSTLSMKLAAEAMDISYPHLARLKKQGRCIQYTQDGKGAPVYFPLWAIAVHNFLKSHPIIPGQITFSNLLSEI